LQDFQTKTPKTSAPVHRGIFGLYGERLGISVDHVGEDAEHSAGKSDCEDGPPRATRTRPRTMSRRAGGSSREQTLACVRSLIAARHMTLHRRVEML
jgi:hypothetical protein